MIRGIHAASSSPAVAAAALAALERGGTAADALVAGFFAHAAVDETGLLGSAVFVVAGPGVGLRCIDGRCVQPGRGRNRPRGFVAKDAVPTAARAAVPRSARAAVLLASQRGKLSLRDLVAPAALLAREAGAEARHALLDGLARRNADALMPSGPLGDAVALFGPAEGGLLSEEDLDGALPRDEGLHLSPVGGAELAVPALAPGEGRPTDVSHVACAAADARGTVGAWIATRAPGAPFAAGELAWPLCAVPVMRGVERIQPGTPLWGHDTAFVLRASGKLVAAGAGKALPNADDVDELLRGRAPSGRIAVGMGDRGAFSLQNGLAQDD